MDPNETPATPPVQDPPAETPAVEVSEEQKKKIINDEKMERAKKATIEFEQLLKKYNCFPDVSITVSTSGKISGSVTILAR